MQAGPRQTLPGSRRACLSCRAQYQDQESVLRAALKEPIAFLGGAFAGALGLNLEEEPLRSWIASTASQASTLAPSPIFRCWPLIGQHAVVMQASGNYQSQASTSAPPTPWHLQSASGNFKSQAARASVSQPTSSQDDEYMPRRPRPTRRSRPTLEVQQVATLT